jgi:hypothetical protein
MTSPDKTIRLWAEFTHCPWPFLFLPRAMEANAAWLFFYLMGLSQKLHKNREII